MGGCVVMVCELTGVVRRQAMIFVIVLQVMVKTVLAALNHFPLFAMMLRWKDPMRLPGGVSLDPCDMAVFSVAAGRWWWWDAFMGRYSRFRGKNGGGSGGGGGGAPPAAARPTFTTNNASRKSSSHTDDHALTSVPRTTAAAPSSSSSSSSSLQSYLHLKVGASGCLPPGEGGFV